MNRSKEPAVGHGPFLGIGSARNRHVHAPDLDQRKSAAWAHREIVVRSAIGYSNAASLLLGRVPRWSVQCGRRYSMPFTS